MPVTRITKEDLKARLDGDDAGRPVLADARLRYPYEHSTMTLPAAVRLAPAAAPTSSLPKDREIVVFDSDPDEITAAQVAATLSAQGYRVQVLKGGLAEWVGANFPVDTKEAVRAPAAATPAKD